eukprot:gene5532-6091_t
MMIPSSRDNGFYKSTQKVIKTISCMTSLSFFLLTSNSLAEGLPSTSNSETSLQMISSSSVSSSSSMKTEEEENTLHSKVSSVSSSLKTEDIPLLHSSSSSSQVDIDKIKLPFEHVNIPLREVLGERATIVFNMKIDDPQTNGQFLDFQSLYGKYKDQGLNILAFPTEQGWFEPDDDETVRLKAKEYFGFGDFPHAVVFDKVDLLGPSEQPAFVAWTKALPTPNGYSRITLNYEKFLLDAHGQPLRRYPRKFTPTDMEADIQAILKGEALPAPSEKFVKEWRQAKREVIKSEYAFRFNYNYYDSPDSMYKYNPAADAL